MYTDEQLAYISGVVGIVGLLIIAWIIYWTPRSKLPRGGFDREYDPMSDRGIRRRPALGLDRHAKRADQPSIRPLSPERRSRYSALWRDQQSRFLDEPGNAVTEADHLVEEMMKERGYPVDELDQADADVSADRPQVIESYRAAHEIVMGYRRGGSNTEDLRRAMIWYRDLFRQLLEDGSVPAGAHHR